MDEAEDDGGEHGALRRPRGRDAAPAAGGRGPEPACPTAHSTAIHVPVAMATWTHAELGGELQAVLHVAHDPLEGHQHTQPGHRSGGRAHRADGRPRPPTHTPTAADAEQERRSRRDDGIHESPSWRARRRARRMICSGRASRPRAGPAAAGRAVPAKISERRQRRAAPHQPHAGAIGMGRPCSLRARGRRARASSTAATRISIDSAKWPIAQP